MCVCLVRVYLDSTLETWNGLPVLAAVSVDKTELIMRLRISWIDGCRFKAASKVLALAKRVIDVADVATKINPGVVENERGIEPG
jgi:hypothetical protein